MGYKLFESTAKPHTYMFAAKYTSTRHNKASYFREWCTPKFFEDAFHDFKTFFRAKTGYEWDYRLQGIRIPKMFVYTPPEEGRPVGAVPMELGGVVRNEVAKEGSEEDSDVEGDEDEDGDEEMDERNLRGATITIHDTDSDVEGVEDDEQLEEMDAKNRRGATITIHDTDSETDSECGRSRIHSTATSFSSCSSGLPYVVCDIGDGK
jgi:hypothetical protein